MGEWTTTFDLRLTFFPGCMVWWIVFNNCSPSILSLRDLAKSFGSWVCLLIEFLIVLLTVMVVLVADSNRYETASLIWKNTRFYKQCEPQIARKIRHHLSTPSAWHLLYIIIEIADISGKLKSIFLNLIIISIKIKLLEPKFSKKV